MNLSTALWTPLADHPVVAAWPLLFIALGLAIRRNMWLYVPFVLPGTLMHELSHLSVGWLLCARPRRFTIMPKRGARELTLGSVSFSRVTWWNALPIGIAPLLLLPLAALLVALAARYRLLSAESAALGYLAAQCCMGCLPSPTDLAHAGRSALVYAVLGAGAWGMWRVLS